MTTAIVYYSQHHGNTKKLLDAIASIDSSVTLFDVTENPDVDLSFYDRIGFASGIYFNSFARQILSFADAHLPKNRRYITRNQSQLLKGIRVSRKKRTPNQAVPLPWL